MPVVGTAGHVDHGKSTLIQRLSGRDPDRWAEEKRRGLTIDLGFAWTTLPSGIEISFVDVPGHERYLKNMLAGIEAIDVALFVVAADEGWMPQSEEHLAVLDLLDVTRGVIALTKADSVDDDLTELAILETSERLQGSTLEDAEIIPVSAIDGTGIEQLLVSLDRLAKEAVVDDRDRPRLWVDRSFASTGSGTVVTGTLLEGAISAGDAVTIYPDGAAARVRGIQSHEESLENAAPGRRVALNLSGIDHAEIGRGAMVGRPSEWLLTNRFVARIKLARYADELDRRGAYQLHIGSMVTTMSILGSQDEFVVIQTSMPIPAETGDRFIVRDTGRKLVVAGGEIVDPIAGKAQEALASAGSIDISSADTAAATLLASRQIIAAPELRRLSGGGEARDGIRIGSLLATNEAVNEIEAAIVDALGSYHQAHPLRVGMPLATLSKTLEVPPEVAEYVVEASDNIARNEHEVSLAGHEVAVDAQSEEAWLKAREQLAAGLAVPAEDDLGLTPEMIHLKQRSGELVRIGPGLVYLTSQVDEMVETLRGLDNDFTVAQFRDATGLSRKYAVPFLEWTDKEGLTTRRGDTRRAR